MNKKCFMCKGNMEESTTTHFADINGKILIIRNVPCFKCCQCGEVAYSLKTAETIEKIIDIVKNSLSEIEIFNYNNVA